MNQLALFNTITTDVEQQPVFQIDEQLFKRVEVFTSKARFLDLSLKSNKEYIVFSRKMMRVSLRLEEYLKEVKSIVSYKTFKAKLHIAKRELSEIKGWLDLLNKGQLLRGNYRNYSIEVEQLLVELTDLTKR